MKREATVPICIRLPESLLARVRELAAVESEADAVILRRALRVGLVQCAGSK